MQINDINFFFIFKFNYVNDSPRVLCCVWEYCKFIFTFTDTERIFFFKFAIRIRPLKFIVNIVSKK